MSSKLSAFDDVIKEAIDFSKTQSSEAGMDPSLFGALNANIEESLEEIDILRGTVQYWESRRPATAESERAMLLEAFRIMHGELLGLTARMKELLSGVEHAVKA